MLVHLLVQLIFYLVLMKDDALLFLVLLLSLSNLNISSRRNESNESNECHQSDILYLNANESTTVIKYVRLSTTMHTNNVEIISKGRERRINRIIDLKSL